FKSVAKGQAARHCAYVVLLKIGDERRVSKPCRRRKPGKQLREDWKRNAGSTGRKGRSTVGYKVLLSVQELLKEAVLEDVRFVVVNRAIELSCVIAGVTNVDSGIGVEFALESKRPLLDVGRGQIRVDCPNTVVRVQRKI